MTNDSMQQIPKHTPGPMKVCRHLKAFDIESSGALPGLVTCSNCALLIKESIILQLRMIHDAQDEEAPQSSLKRLYLDITGERYKPSARQQRDDCREYQRNYKRKRRGSLRTNAITEGR